MSEEVLLDLGFLTEEERDIINGVIFKDIEMRKQEQSRIGYLRNELDHLKEVGLPENEIEIKNEEYCARCQTYFGIIWNRGAFCPRCELKVCKTCRQNVAEEGWMCTLCFKVREVKAQSGAWFFEGHKKKDANLFGSMLVRKSLRRLPGSQSGAADDQKQRKNRPSANTNGFNHHQQIHGDDDYTAEHYNHYDRRIPYNSPGTTDHVSQNPRTDEHEERGLTYSDASESDSDEGTAEDYFSPETISVGSERSHSRGKDLESSHGQRDAETKPENDSSMWNVDLYESRPGEKRLSTEEPDVDVENVQIEKPQAPGKEYGVSEVMETAETEQEIVGGGTKSSEVSSTAEEPNSLESRGNALRAFSESFASMSTDQYGEKHPEDLPGSHAVDPFDDRRSSDPRLEAHGAFNIDNDSGISDTSKYVTPTPSEDTSSKRTSSLSGDEGRTTPTNDGQLQTEEMAPVIVTTAPEKTPKSNRSSITDYGEDHDVSFSKYGATLGNRKLKDQLSMGSRESIVSYYSNAGGEVYGKYPVSGEIYFGIKYDAKIQEFQVQVHQARDITAVDQKNNISDPYVKTYLLPDRTRTGKRKTKVKKNTINPVFDEILTYKISYDEILQRTLWLAVWNYDRFGHNDFLGEVLLPIDEYHQSGYSLEDPEPQWYDLCERQTDDSLLSYNGEIVLALKYVPPSAVVSKKKKKKKKGEEAKGELHVNIIEATNLIAKDSNGFSDPFCKSYLLPDKSKKTKQKTAVVKKNLNPKWNYHFVYEHLTREELLDRVLELTVWDYDRGSSNEFLGGVRLGLGAGIQEWDDANEEEKAAWNVMLNNQNDWNQVTLTLRDNMGQHKYHASAIDLGDRVDSSLLEVQPKTQTSAQDQFDVSLSSQASSRATDPRSDNPDEGLTHHREYHSPLASKIATEIKSLNARRSSPSLTGKESLGHTRMTLAELAKMGTTPAVTEPSPPVTAAPTDKVRVEISPSEYSSSELLIRHSEFYKGSKSPNVSRPKSADSPASFQDILQEQRPTLVDMLQRNEDVVPEEYNLPGSSLMVRKDFMGSRESVYSNAGMFSNNSVSGEIFLGYQYSSGTFKIKIFEARGLTAIDKHKNTSDPYVKVYLLPDQSRAGKRKTKIKHGTLHPEFNEEMLYKIGIIELLTRTMWVSLWNYDRFGRNEFLGEVRIPLGDYKGFDEHPKWYTLSEMDPVSAADNQGELVVALMYSPEEKKKKKGTNKGRLHVKIVEARNLPGKDSDNLSDPFCKSYLLPDPGKKTKKKTPVMKRNLNPRWDHKFTYDNVSLEELQGRVLELTVWDHDLGSSNDFLGGVRIGLGTSDEEWDDCEGEEVALWQFLLSKPNTWTQSTLSLRSQMGYRKGIKT